MALNLKHQTAAELAARFRAKYRDARSHDAAKLAYWLIERINAGDFSDSQLRNAFGMSPVDYTVMKQRLTALHDKWRDVTEAAGE